MILELVLLLVFIVVLLQWWKRDAKNLPPGPTNWFGIGGLLAVHFADPVYPHVAFAKLAKTYGDIMYLKLGVNKTVVFSKYDDMQEIFTKDEFTSRYRFPFANDRSDDKELGILFTSGEVWRDVRRYSTKLLRNFGFKKSEMLAAVIRNEVKDFIAKLKNETERNSGILTVDNTFTMTVVNILWNLLYGFKSKECEELLIRLLKANNDVVAAVAHGDINQAFPILIKICPRLTGHQTRVKQFMVQKRICRELIAESQKRQTVEEDPFNFVQVFLEEIEKNNGNSKSNFTEEQLVITLLDMFFAGSETSSHFLSFCILYLVLYPEVQEKIKKEIDEVLGCNERIPSYAEADRMPYTHAFMYEVFRSGNIVPIPLPRMASADYEYKGFTIPKGSCVMYNLHCVFKDKDFWGDPEIFRPERFLDSTGSIINTERILVFGLGKRFCIGDILAKQTVFAYLTALVKNFTFDQIPRKPPTRIPKSTFTSRPYPFEVLVTPRV